MGARYQTIIDGLRASYDAAVDERAGDEIAPWKTTEWERFLDLLRAESKHSLLEIGSGTGAAASFFAAAGLEVMCTDLSPAMVSHLQQAGLVAVEADVLHLDVGRRFDSAFAMNCLLHVPIEDLADALASVKASLVPGGLFYLGQYGGIEQDGVFAEDAYQPKRYFSWLTDDRLVDIVRASYEIVTFDAVDIGADDGTHFQAAVLHA